MPIRKKLDATIAAKAARQASEDAEIMRELKSQANSAKRELMLLVCKIEMINNKEGKRLAKIVGDIEHWQNS